MTEAPERVWALFINDDAYGYIRSFNVDKPIEYDKYTEYVRADLYDELKQLLYEASQMMVANALAYKDKVDRPKNWVERAHDRRNS